MTVFRGARDDMLAPDLPPLNVERLARMAEVDGSFWLDPEPIRRRRYGLYAKAAAGVLCIAGMTVLALLVTP